MNDECVTHHACPCRVALLAEALEVIRFYGAEENHRRQSASSGCICCTTDDCQNDTFPSLINRDCGEKAREFLKKVGE